MEISFCIFAYFNSEKLKLYTYWYVKYLNRYMYMYIEGNYYIAILVIWGNSNKILLSEVDEFLIIALNCIHVFSGLY